MSRAGITVYELLVSCPGDIIEEIVVVKDVVDEFNNLFGLANDIRIDIKHWSKNSYPESGAKPQEILNKQFIEECDAAVAVFWTRFGTPTDEYGSGTEEEIEKMLNNGKQVFMYFSNKAILPSIVDTEQYKKVIAFKKKYIDRGLYWQYEDLHNFKQLFLNHLSLHFLKIINASVSDEKETNLPKLMIKGIDDKKFSDKINSYINNGSKFIYLLKQEITQTSDLRVKMPEYLSYHKTSDLRVDFASNIFCNLEYFR